MEPENASWFTSQKITCFLSNFRMSTLDRTDHAMPAHPRSKLMAAEASLFGLICAKSNPRGTNHQQLARGNS